MPPAAADGFDPVIEEAERWARLAPEDYKPYYDEDGLLNEFHMMWALRDRFPLHYIVFKQTACHLAHEANVEQVPVPPTSSPLPACATLPACMCLACPFAAQSSCMHLIRCSLVLAFSPTRTSG